MTRLRGVAATLVVTLLISSTAMPVMAANSLTYGFYSAKSMPYFTPAGQEACQIVVWFWVQEVGKSGITRLKARTELRSATDLANIPGTAHFTRDYQYSPYFPDDARNNFQYFSATYRVFSGGTYKLRAKMVGEVASWWKRDVVVKADITTGLGCEKGQVIVTP